MSLTYYQGSDLPDSALTLRDRNEAIIDFSNGYTFSVKVGLPGHAALFTKTSGITGAATDPNVTIAWSTTGELNDLDIGTYSVQLIARRTLDDKHRIFQVPLSVLGSVT